MKCFFLVEPRLACSFGYRRPAPPRDVRGRRRRIRRPRRNGYDDLPRILLFGWIGLSILYLLNPGKPFNAHDLRASLPGVSKVVASIAVYIILFATVGLPLGTFLFLLLFFSLMRYRDIRRMISFALLGAGLTWLVFEKILGVVVPQPFWVGLF